MRDIGKILLAQIKTVFLKNADDLPSEERFAGKGRAIQGFSELSFPQEFRQSPTAEIE